MELYLRSVARPLVPREGEAVYPGSDVSAPVFSVGYSFDGEPGGVLGRLVLTDLQAAQLKKAGWRVETPLLDDGGRAARDVGLVILRADRLSQCKRRRGLMRSLLAGSSKLILILALVLATEASLLTAGAEALVFYPAAVYATSQASKSLALVDVNGDHKLDAVTSGVGVLLGNGDGTFTESISTPLLDFGPFAVADVNEDAKVDLLFISSGYQLSVVLGNGDGTFSARRNFPLGATERALATGDFNQDGHVDVVTVGDDSMMRVMLGDGDSYFASPTTFAIAANGVDVAVDDINGDAKLDVVTLNASCSMSVLLGDGAGGFAHKSDVGLDEGAESFTVADFNRDGVLDLATANPGNGQGNGSVSIFSGDGFGGFHRVHGCATGDYPASIAAADLNGDGSQDIVTANENAGTVSMLLNRGDGSFSDRRDFTLAEMGYSNPSAVAVADLDGDDLPDVTTCDEASPSISVLVQPPYDIRVTASVVGGHGLASPSVTQVVQVGETPTFRFSPDPGYRVNALTVDGVAVGVTKTNEYTFPPVSVGHDVLVSFTPKTIPSLDFLWAAPYTTGSMPTSITEGDFNGDGHEDLAVTCENARISVLLGDGLGGFADRVDSGPWNNAQYIAAGDLNADGLQDLVTLNLYLGVVDVFLSNGSGLFTVTHSYSTGPNSSPRSVLVSDVDRDGVQDLLVCCTGHSDVAVLGGHGDGSFDNAVHYAAGSGAISLATADFNGDGASDLVTADVYANAVSVLLGDGKGSFGAPLDFALGSAPSSVSVGDFNRDGRKDVAAACMGTNLIYVLIGDGQGGFSSAGSLLTDIYPGTVLAEDLDKDGKTDIVTVNGAADSVSVFLGDGYGGFAPRSDYSTGDNPKSLAVGDFDVDGKMDVATADYVGNTISVLLQFRTPGPGHSSISAMVVGGHGTISPQVPQFVVNGATPAFIFAPDPGYHVSQVLVDDHAVSMTGPNEYRFPPISADHTISAVFEPLPTLTVAGPNGGEGWPRTATKSVTWTTSPALGDGNFRLQLYDSTGMQSPEWISPLIPATAGKTSYARSWTITQPASTHWRVRVYYYDGSDSELASDASDADFTVTENTQLTVTAPVSGASWSRGATETVSWTTAPTVMTGSFRVWATPVAGGATMAVSTTVVPVLVGQADYSLACRWTLPSGTWKLSVYYYAAGTTFTTQNAVKPTVTVPLAYAITSSKGTGGAITPLGTTYLPAGGSQGYAVTASSGYHLRDVLVDGTSVGATSTWQFTNVAADHTIAAAFEKNPSITVTSPASGLWPLGGKRTVAWSVSPTLTRGSFRVWATPAAGGATKALSTTVVPVVPGQAAYSLECAWNLPAGDWNLSVFYYDAAGAFKAQNSVKPVFTAAVAYTIAASAGPGGTIAPSGVVTLLPGASQAYSISSNAGYHIVDVLVDGSSVGAKTSYTFSNVAANHTIAASFEKNPVLTVTAPLNGSTWSRNTTQTVSWSVSPAVTVGSFRVWATSVTDGTTKALSTAIVAVVPGQTGYSLDCRWTLPAGGWKLSVYYYASGTTFTGQNSVKPIISVP